VLLGEELGIDPSARLMGLLQRILEHDPSLAAPPAPVLAAISATPEDSESRIPDQSAAAQNRPERVDRNAADPSVIVGRFRELALIGERLNQVAVRRAGALLLLAGEPGIGETTLLAALERQARQQEIAVHQARSPAATGAPAFWLWSQVVGSVAARLSDEALRQACSGSARPVAQLSPVVADRIFAARLSQGPYRCCRPNRATRFSPSHSWIRRTGSWVS